MKMQKLGGFAAIAVICLIVVLLAIVLPFAAKNGLNEQGAGLDPAKVAAAYSSSPATIYIASILEILLAILGLLVILGLYERMHAEAPNLTRIMLIAVSVSCALSIITTMIGFRGMSLMEEIADVSIFKPILMLQNGLNMASTNIEGWILLLIAFAAFSTRALPRFIAYVFLVLGILLVTSFMLPNLQGPTGTIAAVVAMAFFAISYVWLGVIMLKKPITGHTHSSAV